MTQRDPITLHGQWLMDNGVADRAALDADPGGARHRDGRGRGVCRQRAVSRPEQSGPGHLCLRLATAATGRLTFGDAIKEAIAEEMRRDPKVVLMGEDVAEAGTTFKVLTGLVDEFGKDRIIDTPISEAGFTGLGVGAAMTGMRPIVDIMFGDFLMIIMDQVANQAAKIHYMSGGKWKVPMVIRATMGATRRSAAQHSQSLHAWPSHIPGLKVVVPSTPYDAKGLFKSAIRDDNPVVIFEDKISYRKVKGPVPDEDYMIPLGVADVKREGTDITLVAHEQHGAGRARRREDARGGRHQRRGRRSAHDLAARREDAGRVGQEDLALHRHRRGLLPLRRHRRAGVGRFRSRRSTTSTGRCGASARCTCRFRSRRRSRT